MRVLIVDDYRDFVATLKMLLDFLGYETNVAYDGEAAIAAAEAFRPHAIILDIKMPKIDGCEVARRLRNDKSVQDALIVASTAYDGEYAGDRLNTAGFDLCLPKPADPTDILHVLKSWEEVCRTTQNLSPTL